MQVRNIRQPGYGNTAHGGCRSYDMHIGTTAAVSCNIGRRCVWHSAPDGLSSAGVVRNILFIWRWSSRSSAVGISVEFGDIKHRIRFEEIYQARGTQSRKEKQPSLRATAVNSTIQDGRARKMKSKVLSVLAF